MENNTNKNFFKGITRAVLRKSILSYAIIGIAGIINVVILNSFLQQGRPGTPVLVFSILEAAVLVAIFT